jgi:hypothetical protein
MTRHFKATITPTSAEERQLAQVHQEFMGKLQSLPESRRSAFIRATAHNITGKVDPYVRAVAETMKSVEDLKAKVEAARNEIAQIDATDLTGYRPRDPHYRGRMLARRDELVKSIDVDYARAVALSQSDHISAKQEALQQLRDVEARDAKANAILDATDRLREVAAAKDAERRAREIVNAERTNAGQSPLPGED